MFDVKKQLRWSKLKAGLVITLACLALLVAVFFAGSIQNIFSKEQELKIQFKDVKGLRKGAPVWILGIEEGSVKNITLNPVYGVIVTVAVSNRAMRFIKKDSSATVLTMGLLGDKYVELSTGSPGAEPIRSGEIITGMTEVGLAGVMETSGKAIDRITQFMERMDSLITRIEAGQGTIAKLLNDPALYNNLTKTSQSLSVMVGELSLARGTLRLLIEDPSLYNRLLAAASSMEEFSKTLNEPGTLKRLIEDPSLYNRLLAAASSMEEFSKTLNEPGTLKRLIEDPSLYDKTLAVVSRLEEFSKRIAESHGTLIKLIEDPRLYENLNKGSTELSSILARINSGEGLAGALIKDQDLAKELKDTVEELKTLLNDIKEHPKKYFKFSVF
jgi:phospholipid/cholesterol/gamma-HCH transport system substrate-binding protein